MRRRSHDVDALERDDPACLLRLSVQRNGKTKKEKEHPMQGAVFPCVEQLS